MLILCRHIQVYTLGRLSIDGFSFERVAQFNLEWIFSKLDSGFQSLVGFRILSAGFRIPKPRIPDSRSKKFLDSGIRIPLHGAIFNIGLDKSAIICSPRTYNFQSIPSTICNKPYSYFCSKQIKESINGISVY